jgi:hypothetical protein
MKRLCDTVNEAVTRRAKKIRFQFDRGKAGGARNGSASRASSRISSFV